MLYQKVEICGVNTAKLKVLPEIEKKRLLKITREGTANQKKIARDELIGGNLKLVLSVIQRFTNRGENLDDLFQVGCVGLIKAIDNFDINLDVRFSTYAVPMIIGEIRRYLRDNNSVRVSRSLKDIAYKAMQAKEMLIARTGREPRVEEIAKELSISREEVVMALESITQPVSLSEPVYSDSGDTIFVMDQIGDKNDETSWISEMTLRDAIRELPAREKNIVKLRFFEGMTQMEVANEIGICLNKMQYIFKRCKDAYKGDYDAVFDINIHMVN